MRRFRSSPLGLSTAVAAAAMALAGCGGGSDIVEVKFPDVSKLPQPPAAAADKGGRDTKSGPMSKGDPAAYSRK